MAAPHSEAQVFQIRLEGGVLDSEQKRTVEKAIRDAFLTQLASLNLQSTVEPLPPAQPTGGTPNTDELFRLDRLPNPDTLGFVARIQNPIARPWEPR